MAAATSKSSWNLSVLTDPKQPATVYVTAPFDQLVRLAPLMRMLVAMLVYRLTNEREPYRDVSAGGRRQVLLMLDEFGTLGRLPLLEQVRLPSRLRGDRHAGGAGHRATPSALQPKRDLHRDLRHPRQLGDGQPDHPGRGSRRVGETTVSYMKSSRTGSGFGKQKTTRSRCEVRRPLLTEGEVGMLDPERLLVLKAGHPPVMAWKMPYWRHPIYRRRARMVVPEVAVRARLTSS